MSETDRRDLAANGRRLRITHALPYVLFIVAGVALLSVASLLLGGAPLDTVFLITPPAIPAPAIGASYRYLFVLQQPAWALYAISVGVFVAAMLAGLLLARRRRRTDRAH